jgi:hypothetical protein
MKLVNIAAVAALCQSALGFNFVEMKESARVSNCLLSVMVILAGAFLPRQELLLSRYPLV